MNNRIWARVDLGAIRANMDAMHHNTKEDTKLIAVIKADGYGHGAVPIAKSLEPLDYVFGYAVATANEALQLREAGLKKPILILGYVFEEDYPKMIKHDVRMTLFREDQITAISRAADLMGVKAKVHIKVDTGMSRIGITPDDKGMAFIQKAMDTEQIETEGMFTHFARADETDKGALEAQFARYMQFADRVKEAFPGRITYYHASNSAAIIEYPKANLDIARAGIALYGLWPSEEVRKDILPLQPALSVYSRIVYIKDIPAGTAVSYGGTFVSDRPMRIATIPVGYADGYPRGLSGKGEVLIRGKRCRILGRVCMDQFMADVTDLPEAANGDVVTLLGKDGDQTITAEELGNISGRFNYELCCLFTPRVPREYV
ncbi:MAG: alanine racemase [Lachnospiraceae bacterium]|nr:alanine racemase [Lachnospiraceae bacterium]